MMERPDSDGPFSDFRTQLNDRLLDTRTIVLNEALTAPVAGEIAEQLTILDAESSEPVQFVMTTAPGGDTDAALSTYDLLQSLTASVTMIGSGRISGAGVIAFLGGPVDRRYALPHARFRFEEPHEALNSGPSADLEGAAEAAADRRARVRTLLAEATGQSEERVEEDLSVQRGFDAEEAVEYGLIRRVVQSRREIE